jgi:hypothetical protein
MDDTIDIKVRELVNGQYKWFEYNLPYEDFEYIQPILDKCKNKKECPLYDPNDPSTSLSIISSMMSPFSNNKKGVIYNLKEKPSDKTLDEVVDYYNKHNILLIESNKTRTQQLPF